MFTKLSTILHFPTVHIALFLFSIQCSSSAPVDTMYSKFINDLKSNKCKVPEELKMFSNFSITESNEYLSSYLKVCQNIETAIQRKKEALYLCPEILDNLKVILCPPISVKVIVNPANVTLSDEVCKDIGSLKDTVAENKVLKRLTDSILCGIMCEGLFENACKVLLWSYQLQIQKGETEISDKEHPLQIEIKDVPDTIKVTEKNKATQSVEKTTINQQIQIPGKEKQQTTNNLISHIQKTDLVTKQKAENQIPEEQSNLESKVQNPSDIAPIVSSSNILPMLQNDLNRNKSFDAGPQLPQKEGINGNDLPDQDMPHNSGLAEQEDPHDNEEQLPHNGDAAVGNVEPPQNLDNKKLPGLPVSDVPSNLPNDESPDLPPKSDSHLQIKLPQPNDDEGFVEPHDEEEVGEVDVAQTLSNLPVVVSESSHPQDKIKNSNLNNEANIQPESNIQKVAITKEGATSKNVMTTANKQVVTVVNTSSVEKKQSTDGQKATEQPSLPSQKKSVDSSVASSTNKVSSATPTLEEMEEDVHEKPEDREPDQYTDLENTEGDPDDEYARQEYDGRNYDLAKTKEILPDKPNEEEVPKVNVLRPREPTFDDFSLRDKYGRQSVFPEQEDGHFFFYFLSIVLILMAGYLLFHNKQKIIALIVEGRHERRRRSHGVGYKKLETK